VENPYCTCMVDVYQAASKDKSICRCITEIANTIHGKARDKAAASVAKKAVFKIQVE
jgi:hypothetical protein